MQFQAWNPTSAPCTPRSTAASLTRPAPQHSHMPSLCCPYLLPPASHESLLQLWCLFSATSFLTLPPALLWGSALLWCHMGSCSVLGPVRVQQGNKSVGVGCLVGLWSMEAEGFGWVGQKWDRTGSTGLPSHSPPAVPGVDRQIFHTQRMPILFLESTPNAVRNANGHVSTEHNSNLKS